MLRDLADGAVIVRQTSCLDECPSGPNVGIADERDTDDHELMKVVNGVKTEADARELLQKLSVTSS